MTTRCALYARFSTDHQRETSITDQFRQCERYAEREGWRVVAKYKDEAISGARNDRPAYMQLLADAKARKFDAVLVDDLSRLTRDSTEQRQTIKRFRHWGVKLLAVSDGFDSSSKSWKMTSALHGIKNELYLDDLAAKIKRGLTGQAERRFSTGGRTYGYRPRRVYDPSRLDSYGEPVGIGSTIEVEADEAKIVLRVFERYAVGDSPKTIAHTLNADGIKSPRGLTWSQSTLYPDPSGLNGMLRNPKYIGRWRYAWTTWVEDPDTGTSKRVPTTDNEMREWTDESLRIVPQPLWDQVQRRIAEQRERSAKVREALSRQSARTGRGPRYLLSSLLKCGVCNAPFAITHGSSAKEARYGCSWHAYRGPAACTNKRRVSKKFIERKVIETIKHRLFTPEGLDLFRSEFEKALASRRKTRTVDNEAVTRELTKIKQEIAHLVEAVRAGQFASVKEALSRAEAERSRLERQLNVDAATVDKVVDMLPKAAQWFATMVERLENAMQHDTARARTLIKSLVGGEIVLRPAPTGQHLQAVMSADMRGFVHLLEAHQHSVSRKCDKYGAAGGN